MSAGTPASASLSAPSLMFEKIADIRASVFLLLPPLVRVRDGIGIGLALVRVRVKVRASPG